MENPDKSASTIALNLGSHNFKLREAKSFTGAIDELKANSLKDIYHGRSIDCQKQSDREARQIDEKGYETREIGSNQVFLVKEEMLTYRGTKYTLNDIAPTWKKDCRMWLWKNNKQKKKKSEGEVQNKLQ